jgi:hypothetical protein
MYVVAVRLALRIDHAHSLKEKRAVVRRIRARIAERLGIGLSEVGSLDVWQRAELGGAVVNVEHRKAVELIDGLMRMIREEPDCELIAERREELRVDAGDEVESAPRSNDTFLPPAEWLAAEEP